MGQRDARRLSESSLVTYSVRRTALISCDLSDSDSVFESNKVNILFLCDLFEHLHGHRKIFVFRDVP